MPEQASKHLVKQLSCLVKIQSEKKSSKKTDDTASPQSETKKDQKQSQKLKEDLEKQKSKMRVNQIGPESDVAVSDNERIKMFLRAILESAGKLLIIALYSIVIIAAAFRIGILVLDVFRDFWMNLFFAS